MTITPGDQPRPPSLELREVHTSEDVAAVRVLILAYRASLGLDLEFQDFTREVATLPGEYAPPGGGLLLAVADGTPAGCVGVRRLEDGVCEMKRLYVSPAARGCGAGRALALHAMTLARGLGYARMRLDTLPAMLEAQALYHRLGFCEIPAYRDNPVAGTRYLEARL